jgi:hypothetical protein
MSRLIAHAAAVVPAALGPGGEVELDVAAMDGDDDAGPFAYLGGSRRGWTVPGTPARPAGWATAAPARSRVASRAQMEVLAVSASAVTRRSG